MERIFVQIASYRDAEIGMTIRNCLDRAKYPERLTFGICWQYDEKTFTDLDPFLTDRRFRIDQIYYRESNGCCWARNRTNQLYEDEKFTLQIDAHSRFTQDWDVKCITMLQSIDYDKPILTTYPPPYEKVNGEDFFYVDQGIQRLVLRKLNCNLTTVQSTEEVIDATEPGKSQLIGAGFLFTLGAFCREVEYDPCMYFSGEEISVAARAYTWGYNFYYPNRSIMWHLYRHKMPLHWTDHREQHSKLYARSMVRLRTLLLGDHATLGRYGLGKKRTLKQFQEYANLDFQERVNRQKTAVTFQRDVQLFTREIEPRKDYIYWVFCLLDEDEEEIYRSDIKDQDIIKKRSSWLRIEAVLPAQPVSYLLWPFSETGGYGRRLVYVLAEN